MTNVSCYAFVDRMADDGLIMVVLPSVIAMMVLPTVSTSSVIRLQSAQSRMVSEIAIVLISLKEMDKIVKKVSENKHIKNNNDKLNL